MSRADRGTGGRSLSARTKLPLSTKLDFCVLGLGATPDLIPCNPSSFGIREEDIRWGGRDGSRWYRRWDTRGLGGLGGLGGKNSHVIHTGCCEKASTTYIIAVCTKVGAVGFSDTFFDRSYIFASNLPDIEHLNTSTDLINSYSVVLVWVRTFQQH